MPNSHMTIGQRLERLLDAERHALLEGDLATVVTLVAEKEKLVDQLNKDLRISEGSLATLSEKLLRNQALFDGALQGISRIANRMATIRKIKSSFEIYDEFGRKRVINNVTNRKVEKLA